MKFEDTRMLGIRLGSLIVTENHHFLVIKKNEHYSLLNVNTMECSIVEVSLEHIREVLAEDFGEKIVEIIPPEHLKIIAKNVV